MRQKWMNVRGELGMSIVEATLVLAVTVILVAVAVPAASRTLDNARLTRAENDADAIAAAIHNFITEFQPNFTPFTSNGASGGATINILVSDGDTPREVSATGSNLWQAAVNAGAGVDFLERHLVTNTPIGGGSYTTGGANPWRGAYISAPVDADPWGNRYAVNTVFLRIATTNDTFVLSAGPDEELDSGFTLNGARPEDDDFISIIRRDPGLTVP